jgi:hypothetical protein
MIHRNQQGAVSGLGISLVLTVVLLVAALGFGGWAFSSRLDYKNHTDQKIEQAVVIAKQVEGSAKDKQFLQDEKQPLRTYKGPEAYGSLSISYPKTWSGFIDDSGKGTNMVDGYFHPGIVPSVSDLTSVFALRVQVVAQPYDQVATSVDQLLTPDGVSAPPVITPYALPKLPKVVGLKIVGKLPNQKQGTMVILPLRSQTIQIWAETDQFTPDFEANILPNLTFVP